MHHIGSNIKYDGCLLAVSCTAINLSSFFAITAGKEQCNGSRKLRFAHFFRDFHISSIKLSIAIRFQSAKDISYNLFLPVDELEWLTGPCTFGMAETFNKIDCVIRHLFAIGVVRSHKACRCVVFKLTQMYAPPFAEIKIAAWWRRL